MRESRVRPQSNCNPKASKSQTKPTHPSAAQLCLALPSWSSETADGVLSRVVTDGTVMNSVAMLRFLISVLNLVDQRLNRHEPTALTQLQTLSLSLRRCWSKLCHRLMPCQVQSVSEASQREPTKMQVGLMSLSNSICQGNLPEHK